MQTKIIKAIIAAVIILAIIMCGFYLFNAKNPQKPLILTPQQAQNSKIVSNVLKTAKFPLLQSQVKTLADTIKNPAKAKYEGQIMTTGKDLEKTIADGQKNADFAVVVKPDAIKPDDVVAVNQYNVKAYPKHLAEVTIWNDGADVAILKRVVLPKIPVLMPRGAVGYAGPAIGVVDGKTRIGIRLTATF